MQDGRTKTHANLWHITRGQRLRYLSATAATGVSSGFMLLAPLVGMYAIDVIVERDFDKGSPWLVAIARSVDQADPVPCLPGRLRPRRTAARIGECAIHVLFAVAGPPSPRKAIARRLRDALFHRLHHLPAKFFDEADTGDLVQRCSSDVETVRVFLATNVVEIGRSILLITAMSADPVLARCAAGRPEPVPDAVHHRPAAYLFFSLVKRQFKVARRSRRQADGGCCRRT